jgi:hypothetical protein
MYCLKKTRNYAGGAAYIFLKNILRFTFTQWMKIRSKNGRIPLMRIISNAQENILIIQKNYHCAFRITWLCKEIGIIFQFKKFSLRLVAQVTQKNHRKLSMRWYLWDGNNQYLLTKVFTEKVQLEQLIITSKIMDLNTDIRHGLYHHMSGHSSQTKYLGFNCGNRLSNTISSTLLSTNLLECNLRRINIRNCIERISNYST